MTWQDTYLGTQVAIVAASDDAYAVLDEAGWTSFGSGGCAVLAVALTRVVEGELFAITVQEVQGEVDHVCVRVGDDAYIDQDGAYSSRQMLTKHLELEGRAGHLALIQGDDFGEIECPEWAVAAMEGLLRERLE